MPGRAHHPLLMILNSLRQTSLLILHKCIPPGFHIPIPLHWVFPVRGFKTAVKMLAWISRLVHWDLSRINNPTLPPEYPKPYLNPLYHPILIKKHWMRPMASRSLGNFFLCPSVHFPKTWNLRQKYQIPRKKSDKANLSLHVLDHLILQKGFDQICRPWNRTLNTLLEVSQMAIAGW